MGFRLWGTLVILGLVALILTVKSLFGDTVAFVIILAVGLFLLVKSFMGWDKVLEKKK